MRSLDCFGGDHLIIDDSLEGDFARERLNEVSSRPYELLRAPATYDEALESVCDQFERLSSVCEEVRVGVRECCITGESVLMVWVPGGVQYHISLKDMLGDFEVDQFSIDISEYLEANLVMLDEYLIVD